VHTDCEIENGCPNLREQLSSEESGFKYFCITCRKKKKVTPQSSSKGSPKRKSEDMEMEIEMQNDTSKKCLILSKIGSETSKCGSESSESDFKEETQRGCKKSMRKPAQECKPKSVV